ncbi:hypothetical protein Thiowin_01102 [Thiorhodovibrio winogradskyi]|uniref:Uncharacterized protein n=2 Tax=Thiorhodovibrio winogradskyi TaxID=77007 RepID=A0ABZ0S6M2_9GAMM
MKGQPSTVLQGAGIDAARSIAMASARSKGWTLVSVADESESAQQGLKLERGLSHTSPQAIALGALPDGPAPKVQVSVDFEQHDLGTEVGLRAFVIVNPGTESEKRIEYTDDYQDALAISLSSLQSAWLATGHRLASAAPVPETPRPAPDDITDPSAAEQAQVARVATESAIDGAERAEVASEDGATAAPDQNLHLNQEQEPEPERNQPQTQQVADASAETVESTIVRRATDDNSAAGQNQMLVLNTGARTGTWAYYAEGFAERQGCEVTSNGAVLLQKNPTFELHEVACRNGPNLLLKCQDGVCGSIR